MAGQADDIQTTEVVDEIPFDEFGYKLSQGGLQFKN